MISGAVAGLVAITPASGFVNPQGALIIGIAAGVVCYFSSVWVKKWLGYDDALDTWGVHGVGGALGAMMTGMFASNAINSARNGWLIDGNVGQMWIQFYDVAAVFVYCGIGTFIILKVIDIVIGIRVSQRSRSRGSRHQPPRRNHARLTILPGACRRTGALAKAGAPFSLSGDSTR